MNNPKDKSSIQEAGDYKFHGNSTRKANRQWRKTVRRQGKKAGLRYHIDQIASEHGLRGSSNINKSLQEICNEKENNG